MRAAGVVNVTNYFDVFTTRIIRFLRKFLKIDFFAYCKMGDSDGDYVVFDRKKKRHKFNEKNLIFFSFFFPFAPFFLSNRQVEPFSGWDT